MPSWNELLEDYNKRTSDADRYSWLNDTISNALKEISRLRGGRNVMLYGSAFLQKPSLPGTSLMIMHEDMNGTMSVIHRMDWQKGLTLLLHTPGGDPNAAESLVSYLRAKFDDIEVIVPALAMSAGTMVSLAADRIVMGRQSQLGPIDPQMQLGQKSVSARAIVEQFNQAAAEIAHDQTKAHLWAPILQAFAPALLQEAQNALDYSEQMVARWLDRWMLNGSRDGTGKPKADCVASHFNDATTHKSHGRRIDRDEARKVGVIVEDLENDQNLQESVLTTYHGMTILFEQSPTVKLLWSSTDRTWVKNWTGMTA